MTEGETTTLQSSTDAASHSARLVAGRQGPMARATQNTGGFDLIVGNPPFVTARNPEKRELYRERWPRVCHREYELVSPFFQRSFGLLSGEGQLAFIVSNGFTMRDFGKPLVEQFFPTVHLQKIVDCDGLSFPGHGTPTCIVFGRQPSLNETPDVIRAHPVIVAARLPGGGDLRTIPEESPLWFSLSAHHDDPGYQDERIVVAQRKMAELAKWPMKFDTTGQSTRELIEQGGTPLSDFIEACGSLFDTHKDDAFVLADHVVRRARIELKFLVQFVPGDQFRNWFVFDGNFVLKPYDQAWELLKEDKQSGLFNWLRMLQKELGGRATFSGETYDEAGEPWYRYHQMSVSKITAELTVAYPEIATHAHFVPLRVGSLLPQTAPVLQLANENEEHACLLAGILNTSAILFWLKQVSFNKGAGKDEQLDRFEYQGKRIKQIPISPRLTDAVRGKPNAVAERLTVLSRACWERGRKLPSLALRKLFEKSGEAYHAWNAALPGHVAPHANLGAPFTTTTELNGCFARAVSLRDQFRAGMVARQEEMDWLVYAAYGLVPADHPAARVEVEPALLAQAQRPFRLWESAGGDFAKAVVLIPATGRPSGKTFGKRVCPPSATTNTSAALSSPFTNGAGTSNGK